MYEVIVILKALTEVAGVSMIGQDLLWVLADKTLTSPVMKATKAITPRIVLDQHLGLVAFFLLVVIWVVLTAFKIKIVMANAPPAKVHYFIEQGARTV